MELPPELWDLILEKLSEIGINSLGLSRLISNFFNLLILNNRNLYFKIILSINKILNCNPSKQLKYICGKAIIPCQRYSVRTSLGQSVTKLTEQSSLDSHNLFNIKKTRLNMAKWLISSFNISSKDVINIRSNILRIACKHGNTEIAEWLVEIFKFTTKYVRNNDILLYTCLYGQFETLKWLVDTFQLTVNDIEESNIFSAVCDQGHLEMAKWLVSKFNLTKEIVKGFCNHSLRNSCLCRQLETIKWLDDAFNLVKDDIKDTHDIMRISCEYGYIEILRWLMETFNLSDRYILDSSALKYAYLCKNLEVLRYLLNILQYSNLETWQGKDFLILLWCICGAPCSNSVASHKEHSSSAGESSETQLELIKWAVDAFDLTSKITKDQVKYVLSDIQRDNRKIEIFNWVSKTFNI